VSRRKPQFRPYFLDKHQLSHLLNTLQRRADAAGKPHLVARVARDYAICAILCLQGLRVNEVRMLDIEDARFTEEELVVRYAKGGKIRRIPLYATVAAAIQWYLEVRRDPKPGHERALFLSGERTRIATRTIRSDAKKWARMAGLSAEFHPHSGRHTSVVRQREAGCTLEAVRDFHGHTNISITDRYSHLTPQQHLREEIAKADPSSLLEAAR
jgi:site-specific recombinase XerC